jgi:hypothetical protein
MHLSLLAMLSLALLLSVVMLVRETRLRRSLQRLLHRLLSLWRNAHEEIRSPNAGGSPDRRTDRL